MSSSLRLHRKVSLFLEFGMNLFLATGLLACRVGATATTIHLKSSFVCVGEILDISVCVLAVRTPCFFRCLSFQGGKVVGWWSVCFHIYVFNFAANIYGCLCCFFLLYICNYLRFFMMIIFYLCYAFLDIFIM